MRVGDEPDIEARCLTSWSLKEAESPAERSWPPSNPDRASTRRVASTGVMFALCHVMPQSGHGLTPQCLPVTQRPITDPQDCSWTLTLH